MTMDKSSDPELCTTIMTTKRKPNCHQVAEQINDGMSKAQIYRRVQQCIREEDEIPKVDEKEEQKYLTVGHKIDSEGYLYRTIELINDIDQFTSDEEDELVAKFKTCNLRPRTRREVIKDREHFMVKRTFPTSYESDDEYVQVKKAAPQPLTSPLKIRRRFVTPDENGEKRSEETQKGSYKNFATAGDFGQHFKDSKGNEGHDEEEGPPKYRMSEEKPRIEAVAPQPRGGFGPNKWLQRQADKPYMDGPRLHIGELQPASNNSTPIIAANEPKNVKFFQNPVQIPHDVDKLSTTNEYSWEAMLSKERTFEIPKPTSKYVKVKNDSEV